MTYRQIFDISRTLIANKIVYNSYVVGATNYILIRDLTPGFNALGKADYKTRRETLSFGIWCTLYQRFNGNIGTT